MSADVINLDDHRPHEVGPVVCTSCGYSYILVIPVKRDVDEGFECPECHKMTVRWMTVDEAEAASVRKALEETYGNKTKKQ
jgi:transcription elongation factor Elf1